MSQYPNLSHRQYRGPCCYKEETVCPTFPCVHSECHVPDYLDDSEEFLANNEVYCKACDLYNSLYGKTPSSTLKEQLSAEEWAFYEPKVDRCHRLRVEKKEQIRQEIKAHKMRREAQYRKEEEEILNDESLKDDPVIRMHKWDKKGASLQTRL